MTNENKCVVDGVRYVAVATVALRKKCAECDMFVNTGVDCDADCPCMPITRTDHRNIIWKLANKEEAK